MKKVLAPLFTLLFAPLACDVLLQEQYPLASTTSLPEGVAFDEDTYTFFATAIRGGKITRLTPFGDEIGFYSDDTPNRSFGGAHVDSERRRLWVCVVDVASNPFPVSQVFGFHIDTRERTHAISLPEPTFCNDLVTDADGVVYATDSATPRVFRIDPASSQPAVFATLPLTPPAGGVGLNGIDFSPDGARLLVASSMPAKLFSVPLAAPEAAVEVATVGDPFSMPGNPRFPGPDGLEFIGEQLFVAYDGGVQRLTFSDDDWTQASVATTMAVPTGLTSLTEAGGELYAIDSEVFRVLYQGQQPQLPFAVVHVDQGLF
ncbi:MAG: SMP-30/gluconolactonase/LRE family protein [Myxococcales bacterium]|nr:SMP-30/gluconolactonase/LRE family protein [Myxococcales bacterium]